jgi:hypothetical protein
LVQNFRDEFARRAKGTVQKGMADEVSISLRLGMQDLLQRRSPPTNARVLVRDFIHDSLYNPTYGYFSKQAYIYIHENYVNGILIEFVLGISFAHNQSTLRKLETTTTL